MIKKFLCAGLLGMLINTAPAAPQEETTEPSLRPRVIKAGDRHTREDYRVTASYPKDTDTVGEYLAFLKAQNLLPANCYHEAKVVTKCLWRITGAYEIDPNSLMQQWRSYFKKGKLIIFSTPITPLAE